MFIDATTRVGNAQTLTSSGASTDYIDTKHSGDSYEGAWFVVVVTTAFTRSAGALTATFDLRTDASSGFGTDTVLVSTGAIAKASLTAGATFAIRIPAGALRYLRGYSTVSTTADAGAASMFIAKDVDLKMVSQV